jgi:hypothetical protein
VKPTVVLTDGSIPTPDHKIIDPETGMQKGYLVLSAEERAKGYLRPVRYAYKHLACGFQTTITSSIAETYARDPKFYSGTYCVNCREHFPIGPNGQFVWSGTDIKVGT